MCEPVSRQDCGRPHKDSMGAYHAALRLAVGDQRYLC